MKNIQLVHNIDYICLKVFIIIQVYSSLYVFVAVYQKNE